MNYTNVLKEFNIEYEAPITLLKDTKPVITLLYKNQIQLKWIESFKYFPFCTYGLRHCPLLYVVQEDDDVPNEAGDPLVSVYSCGASGYALDESIAHIYHTYPLYKSDNAMVYSLIEEATRGIIYATKINLYAQSMDGRSDWAFMISSHAG